MANCITSECENMVNIELWYKHKKIIEIFKKAVNQFMNNNCNLFIMFAQE